MNFQNIRKNLAEQAVTKKAPTPVQPKSNEFERKVRMARSSLGLSNLNVSAVVAADKIAQKNKDLPYNQLLNKIPASSRKHYVDFQSAVPSDIMDAPVPTYQQALQKLKLVRPKQLNNSHEIEETDLMMEASDPPMMLILKRKGIRLFPDGKRAALYVNDKLGLTFMLPYGPDTQAVANIQAEEVEFGEDINENVEHIKSVAQSKKPKTIKFKTGETMELDPLTADAISKVHSSLNDENKIKVADMVSHSPTKFKQVALFALQNVTHKVGK